MKSKMKLPVTISIIAALLLNSSPAKSTNELDFPSSLENFRKNIFSEIFESEGHKNIIFSPFSIQTCLAMLRQGADGETAIAMDKGLSFTGQSSETVADNFHSILTKYENSKILKIANRIYVEQQHELNGNYKDILTHKFLSSAENIDFVNSATAANTINDWIQHETNNTIKDLVSADSFSSDTRLLLLNTIHFKGSWESPFDRKDTAEADFYTDETNTVRVQMMFQWGGAYKSYLRDIDATAVRLPYHDSDLSLVVLLPKGRNGLSDMLEKLKNVNLKWLRDELDTPSSVKLYLPKFKVEREINLNDILKKMGMKEIYESPDFSHMLKNPEPLAVSDVIHKALIEVNEVGTEAGCGTGIEVFFRSGPTVFKADHPFYYIIMNDDGVPMFQGIFLGV